MTEIVIDERICLAIAEIDMKLSEMNSELVKVNDVQDFLLDLRSLLTKENHE